MEISKQAVPNEEKKWSLSPRNNGNALASNNQQPAEMRMVDSEPQIRAESEENKNMRAEIGGTYGNSDHHENDSEDFEIPQQPDGGNSNSNHAVNRGAESLILSGQMSHSSQRLVNQSALEEVKGQERPINTESEENFKPRSPGSGEAQQPKPPK